MTFKKILLELQANGTFTLSVDKTFITIINMTVKHNNLLILIIGCLYVSFFGLHVSVILMTIIRSVRAKEIAMQQIFVAWQLWS